MRSRLNPEGAARRWTHGRSVQSDTRVMRRLGIAGLAAFFAATVAVDARAGDEDDIEALLNENVVSGASKSAESASDAPATVVTLSGEDMNRFGMRSLAEAINFLGAGLVTQDPLHSVEIGGRGVLLTSDFGNHVLIVVDGHALTGRRTSSKGSPCHSSSSITWSWFWGQVRCSTAAAPCSA